MMSGKGMMGSGGMMGSRGMMGGGGMMRGVPMMGGMGDAVWTINGTSMTGDDQPNMPPLFTLRRGKPACFCCATIPRRGIRCTCTVTAFG